MNIIMPTDRMRFLYNMSHSTQTKLSSRRYVYKNLMSCRYEDVQNPQRSAKTLGLIEVYDRTMCIQCIIYTNACLQYEARQCLIYASAYTVGCKSKYNISCETCNIYIYASTVRCELMCKYFSTLRADVCTSTAHYQLLVSSKSYNIHTWDTPICKKKLFNGFALMPRGV